MKKLIYLIVVSLILGLVLTGCSLLSNISQVPATDQSGVSYLTKGTLTSPDVFTLYAGQDIDVGTVSVWHDGVELHVTYNTTGDWVLTETHLAVATSIDGIPQNKNDNPIPGKFSYKHEDLGGVTSDPYMIPLNGWDVETELLIAAHASLLNLVDTVDVYADETDPTCSTVILESGMKYLLKASGTAFAGDTIWFDAKYSNSKNYSSPLDSWTDEVAGYTSYGPDLLGLAVDGVFVDWGVYNDAHVYYWNMDGIGSCVPLRIYDTYYPNNEGFLKVEIYQEESAWAVNGEGPDFIGSMPFLGKNWATYFTYESETWTRSGEFKSQRYLKPGLWEYDVSFTKTFSGVLSHGEIVLTDPNDIEIVADVQDIKSNYPYWASYIPNYAAVGTATYDIYDGYFMFLIADEYIWMALSGNDYSIPWGVGSVWSSGRDYDILSLPGTYW